MSAYTRLREVLMKPLGCYFGQHCYHQVETSRSDTRWHGPWLPPEDVPAKIRTFETNRCCHCNHEDELL